MLAKLRARMSYANVVSTLALALAVGGGSAYAATKIGSDGLRYHAVTASKLANNAVTPSKVKDNSLSGRELRDNSITSADIRNGTLQAGDFAAGQLPKGDKGDPGVALFGVVTADGGLASGRGVTALGGTPAGGAYVATFGQDVSKCAAIATLTGGPGGTVTAAPTSGNPAQVTFQTREGAVGTPRAFQFAIAC